MLRHDPHANRLAAPSRVTLTAMTIVLTAAAAQTAHAQAVKLPEALTITAYDTGSSGFNISVAVGKAIKDKYGSDVRIIPAGNDVARLGPLRGNRAVASAMGVGGYFAQEGAFEFATKEWGPQPLRLMLSSLDCNGISLAVAADTGVKEIKDLKGKRIGVVVGSPALNQNAFAILAFAGLTKQDVKLVEFSSNNAMWKGMLNNETDTAIGSTIAGQAREVETSPRSLVYPLTPHADKAGWERLLKIAPYFQPHKATCGVGASPAKPLEVPTYAYPIFMTYAAQPADAVRALTKGMIDGYPLYKDGAPGAAGLDVKQQNLKWVMPYHEGAVAALKEAGVWTEDNETHNKKLVQRQDTLVATWTAFLKGTPPDDKDTFTKAWMAARKDALTKAGMDSVLE
jgi:TRAP transporter TAXI family solute receptor